MAIITSPVDSFPGTVNCPDVLTLPQALAIETMMSDVKALGEKPSRVALDNVTMPVLLPLFSDWKIDGVPEHPTVDNFPASPRAASAVLCAWLFNAVFSVYIGETEIPNA